MLKYLKGFLKENGKIYMAINNKLAVKYMCGAKSEYIDEKLYTKSEIEDIILKSNFANYEFYYPVPDYKITNVIYSDKYIPLYNDSKLMYNLNYIEGSLISSNELENIKKITKEGMFDKFTNSFLVIINNSDINLESEDIRFISYNNMRKEEYRIITKILDGKVEKKEQNKEAAAHIEMIKNNIESLSNFGFDMLDEYKDGKIYSTFCKFKSFSRILLDMYRNSAKEEVLSKIKYWYDFVVKKLPIIDKEDALKNNIFSEVGIDVDENTLQTLNFTKYGFFDLVFENCFVDEENGKMLFYDQEWILEYLPLEFIIYRAINNIYLYDFGIEKIIPKNEVLEFLGVGGYEEIFEELEIYIQFKVLDKKRVTAYSKSYESKINIDEIYNKNDLIRKLEEEKDEILGKSSELSNKITSLEKELDEIRKSKIYKFIKIFKK